VSARSTAEWLPLAPGDFVRAVYALWRRQATGVLTVAGEGERVEVLVLRRGDLMVPEADALGRLTSKKLEGICSWRRASYHFDGGIAAYPPGSRARRFQLGHWARRHLEAQLSQRRAEELMHELAGVRLLVRSAAVPAALLDDTDRRIVSALSEPRRLDQVWALARCPKFRLLGFIHFLRELGAIELGGVAAPRSEPELGEARRLLGVTDGDDEAIKRAYRKRVRALHPDLRPGIGETERRLLEERLAQINRAYELLMARATI